MAWFFLAQVTVPNLSTVMFYHQTEVLNLDASFLGTARVVGWLGLMLGTFTYNRYVDHETTEDSLVGSHWVVFVDPPRYNFSVSSEPCLQNFRQDPGHLWICPC
ncbi:FOLATE-BIOPTERIN TRANSPORTER 4-RELATED [Salix purpurea]|uniref:FOLATE-BIOPTERIN TRANSPORTER 4-RELATED n=1 Tax=Salix purpurea TaxID=77065 RepID=A0A9Q0VRD0_SALPP|nr:FOLATE-BIOPTERIN TRANSPORTER 4-RELATED [Salix purpurea]